MSRRCMVTGKGVMSGNNVSHAKNRTRRRFLPNVQDTSVYSEILKRKIKLRVTAAGLRTIEHKGGLDSWLMNTAPTKLEPSLRPIKAQIEKVKGKNVPDKEETAKKAPAKKEMAKKVPAKAKKTTTEK